MTSFFRKLRWFDAAPGEGKLSPGGTPVPPCREAGERQAQGLAGDEADASGPRSAVSM